MLIRDLSGPVEGDWCVMLVGGHERAPEVDDAEAQSLEAAHVPHAAGSAAGRCGVDAETAAEVAGAREVRVLRDVAADGLVVEHLDHVGLDDWRPVDCNFDASSLRRLSRSRSRSTSSCDNGDDLITVPSTSARATSIKAQK